MQDKRAVQVGIIVILTIAVVLVLYFTSTPSKDNFRPATPKTTNIQAVQPIEQRPPAIDINRSWPTQIAALARRAMSYTVIKSQLVHERRPTLLVVITSPYANGYEQFLGTAIKVARSMAISRNVAAVHVLLEPNEVLIGKGYQLADVALYTDGKGEDGQTFNGVYWQASAMQNPYSPQQLQVANLWFQHQSEYLDSHGKINESELKSYIAEQLNIPDFAVKLPQSNRLPLTIDNQPSD
ncbi:MULTISPECIES: hypothetical protein [Shewanella]|jgi:hypothetical protein|uniref:DUF4875 domain-containing protein n=1 Tax=Shewanella TaxID=22 RepID=UPI00167735A0|nr:hypothetical protein [Shewanella fodinae]MCL2906903.1 hypothetical protein [Shewanella fodinae]GGZ05407.1 hypothetical protein GCM10007169_22580 [Shewanella fodinae]